MGRTREQLTAAMSATAIIGDRCATRDTRDLRNGPPNAIGVYLRRRSVKYSTKMLGDAGSYNCILGRATDDPNLRGHIVAMRESHRHQLLGDIRIGIISSWREPGH